MKTGRARQLKMDDLNQPEGVRRIRYVELARSKSSSESNDMKEADETVVDELIELDTVAARIAERTRADPKSPRRAYGGVIDVDCGSGGTNGGCAAAETAAAAAAEAAEASFSAASNSSSTESAFTSRRCERRKHRLSQLERRARSRR